MKLNPGIASPSNSSFQVQSLDVSNRRKRGFVKFELALESELYSDNDLQIQIRVQIKENSGSQNENLVYEGLMVPGGVGIGLRDQRAGTWMTLFGPRIALQDFRIFADIAIYEVDLRRLLLTTYQRILTSISEKDPRGFCFWAEPGWGKTTFLKHCVKDSCNHHLSLEGNMLPSDWVKQVQALASIPDPKVLFIDEFDKNKDLKSFFSTLLGLLNTIKHNGHVLPIICGTSTEKTADAMFEVLRKVRAGQDCMSRIFGRSEDIIHIPRYSPEDCLLAFFELLSRRIRLTAPTAQSVFVEWALVIHVLEREWGRIREIENFVNNTRAWPKDLQFRLSDFVWSEDLVKQLSESISLVNRYLEVRL